MVEKRVFGQLGPRITFKCSEGDITMVTIDGVQGVRAGPVFDNPIRDKDILVLTDEMLVKTADPATDTGLLVIGRAVGNPEFIGMEPTADAVAGDYEERIVTVELMGTRVDMVTLVDDNAAVDTGANLGLADINLFDVAVAPENIIALEDAEMDTGASIAALFGFYGYELA